MTLRSRLEAVVDGMPEGSTVSLPVDWLRNLLDAEPPEASLPDLLDLEDAAEVVGRAVSTVRTWCNQDQIDGAFKLQGREWKIPRQALARFLEEQGREEDEPPSVPTRGPVDLGSWRKHREAS